MTRYRVVQLRTRSGREETIEIESGFGSITDAIDYCDEHDPDSTLGYRAEGQPQEPTESVTAA